MKRISILLFIICSFALLSLAFYANYFLTQPLLKQRSNQNSITINFKNGMSAKTMVNLISSKQPLQCQFCFAIYLRLLSRASNFKAGIYQLDQNITAPDLVEKVINGDVLQQELIIKEGQTSLDIIKELNSKPFIEKSSSIVNDFIKQCDLCSSNMEGALLADTYFFNAGSNSIDVLQRSYQALIKVLNEIWLNRQLNLPYKNYYELLIAASIIEKEAANKAEKEIISAVIVNRLRKNMRLQMDPTVIYGLGDKYKFPLTKKDLHVTSPYNTYLHKGLPPTPICNVGLDALYAAAQPKAVDYLYFVANEKGLHDFSTNLKQQNEAVNRLRQHQKK